jgi:hypothetical protein
MVVAHASMDTMNQHRSIQANLEHYDDRAVFALVANTFLINQRHYRVTRLMKSSTPMVKRPMVAQLAFT